MHRLHHTLWILRLAWSVKSYLIVGILITTTASALFPAALALISRELINAISSTASSTVSSTLLSGAGEENVIRFWILLGFCVTAVEVISGGVNTLFKRRLIDELNIRVSLDIMHHAATLELAFFEDAASQDMLERLRRTATAQVSQFVTGLLAVVMNGLQLTSLLVILLVIEPLIGLFLPFVLLPYFLFQWYLARETYQVEVSRSNKRRWTKYFVWITTDYQWMSEVKLLNLTPLFAEKVQRLLIKFREEDHRLYQLNFIGNTLYALFAAGLFFGLFARLANRVTAGATTIGDVAIYAGATVRLRTSLQNLILAIKALREQYMCVEDLYNFLHVQPQQTNHSGGVLLEKSGELVFKDVSFTYVGTTQPVLSNLSFCIDPGETVALVGENGAGKSTLVKLMAGLYEPTAGQISFAGVDIADLSAADWQRRISFVFQNYNRYEASAADNIGYGDWERWLEGDIAQVEEIARLANADTLVSGLPDGYETMVGQRFADYSLSEGQWQKLAIARAFARQESRLLIFDEPTASLDARAEYELFRKFRQLAAGRTTILISHRFSTVQIADRILVLKQGRILEDGTHQELLRQNGYYAELYHLQAQDNRYSYGAGDVAQSRSEASILG